MVVKETIKAELKVLYAASLKGLSEDEFADGMADIIKNAVLSAQVNFPISVQVTPSNGTGATTSTGSLS